MEADVEAQSPYATTRAPGFARRLATETKQAFRTTEFWAYATILAALFIAGAVTDASTTTTGTTAAGGTGTTVSPDPLPASKVWLYAAILTVGYMVARGLAKAGSRDPYWDQPSQGGDGTSITERVKGAAQVLKEGDGAHQEPGARN
jgi:hypothetical protein